MTNMTNMIPTPTIPFLDVDFSDSHILTFSSDKSVNPSYTIVVVTCMNMIPTPTTPVLDVDSSDSHPLKRGQDQRDVNPSYAIVVVVYMNNMTCMNWTVTSIIINTNTNTNTNIFLLFLYSFRNSSVRTTPVISARPDFP